MSEPITGYDGAAAPAWAPLFESEWPFSIPDRFTDNAWRSGQTATRAAQGLRPLPSYPSTAQITIFCDPSYDQLLPETGTGTETDPFVLIVSARNAALDVPTAVIGIATGRRVFFTADLTDTSAAITFNNHHDGVTLCAWFRDTAERHPTRIERATLYGTTAGDWEEINDHPHGGTPTVIFDGSGPGYTLLVGSGVWHLKTPATTAGSIGMLGFGSYDSVATAVGTSNYKSHGWNAKQVMRNCAANSGVNTIVPGSNYAALEQDMQWNSTTLGGVLVKSPTNPATRWGGVWMASTFDACLSIADCDDFKYLHALQFNGAGLGLRLTVNAAKEQNRTHAEGIYTRMCVSPYYLSSVTNGKPALTGSVGKGSINKGAPGNETLFGDGTMPWLQDCEMYYIRCLQSIAGPQHYGWWRRMKIHDIRTHLSRLQGGTGCFFIGECYAYAYDDYNELFNFNMTCLDCGTGTFGFTDGGVDYDGQVCNIRMHHGRIAHSLRGWQITGDDRGQHLYMVDMVDVVQGIAWGGSMHNGLTEGAADHVRIVLSNPADWHTCQQAVIEARDDLTHNIGLELTGTIRYVPAGPTGTTQLMSKNNSCRARNVEIDLGTGDGSTAEAVRNECFELNGPAPIIFGPWDDSDANGVGVNGFSPVPTGQVQDSTMVPLVIDGLHLVGAFTPALEFTDRTTQPCETQRTLTTRLVHSATSQRDDFGNFLATAPAEVRGGATFLDAVLVGPAEPYMQPPASRLDLLGVPSASAADTSIGPYFYRATTDGGGGEVSGVLSRVVIRAARGAPLEAGRILTAGSDLTLNVSALNADDQALTPDTLRWRLDAVPVTSALQDWTTVPAPADPTAVLLPGDLNDIIAVAALARLQFTVEVTVGTSTQRETYLYYVRPMGGWEVVP